MSARGWFDFMPSAALAIPMKMMLWWFPIVRKIGWVLTNEKAKDWLCSHLFRFWGFGFEDLAASTSTMGRCEEYWAGTMSFALIFDLNSSVEYLNVITIYRMLLRYHLLRSHSSRTWVSVLLASCPADEKDFRNQRCSDLPLFSVLPDEDNPCLVWQTAKAWRQLWLKLCYLPSVTFS